MGSYLEAFIYGEQVDGPVKSGDGQG